MNNKDKERKKYTRKVILLKYKDTRERLVLTQTVKKRKESLKIEIRCVSQPAKEVNQKINQHEKYPIFRAQLKNRIVPHCLRDKCRRDVKSKTKQCNKRHRRHRQYNSEQESESLDRNDSKSTASIITLSDEEYDGLQYEDISSCTDDEVDILLESTRKRMKDSDEEWRLLPRKRFPENDNMVKKNIYKRATRSHSLNSIDTLVLDNMENKLLTTPELDTIYSPITSPEEILKLDPHETSNTGVKRRLKLEPSQSLKREEYSNKKEVEQSNPKKKIKLEQLEAIKSDQHNENIQSGDDRINFKYAYAAFPETELANTQNRIKPEPLETNNNTMTYKANDMCIEDKKYIKLEQ